MTRKTTTLTLVLATAGLLATACGSEPNVEGSVAGKPEGTGGAEALVFPASARVDADEGRRPEGELQMRVWAPTPVGALREDALEAYRVVLEAENTGGEPLTIDSAWARARFESADQGAFACVGAPVAVPDTSAVAGGGSLFVSLPAPCALETPGRYGVFVDLSIGAPFGSDGARVRSARHEITVDDALPPFRGDELPPLSRR